MTSSRGSSGECLDFICFGSASNALQFNAIQLRVLGGVTPPDPPERKCGFILVIH